MINSMTNTEVDTNNSKGYRRIKVSNFDLKIIPSEYVYGGPSNQHAFFEELLSLQFEGLSFTNIKEKHELHQLASRLSMISNFQLNGKCYETTQHQLET